MPVSLSNLPLEDGVLHGTYTVRLHRPTNEHRRGIAFVDGVARRVDALIVRRLCAASPEDIESVTRDDIIPARDTPSPSSRADVVGDAKGKSTKHRR